MQDMLFNKNEAVAADNMMKVFTKVTDVNGKVHSHRVHIRNSRQSDHLVDLLSANMSFIQISKAMKCARENLGVADKAGS